VTDPSAWDDDSIQVVVQRSQKRRRTVGARLRGDVLTVTLPWWMTEREGQEWADKMLGRFMRARSTERIDLAERATALARRFDLPSPIAIRWSDNMEMRWASCTPTTGTIRVSTRLAAFPDWVVDYVLVHELAHLLVADHSPAFWTLVERYPLTERARGFLIAKSGDDSPD
jgi:predicted metal-dependent hydrolase